MATLLQNSIFVHVPKTAGTWARKSIENAGMSLGEIKGMDWEYCYGRHNTHNIPTTYGKPMFCFVRHPLSWYKSYFAYRQICPWEVKQIMLDARCKADTFSDFIDNVRKEFPKGYLWRVFDIYQNACSYVGKQENVKEDLVEILNIAEGGIDVSMLLADRENTSESSVLSYTEDQKDWILNNERRILDRNGYTEEEGKQ